MIVYGVDNNTDFDDNTAGGILPDTDLGQYRLAIFNIVGSYVGTLHRYIAPKD